MFGTLRDRLIKELAKADLTEIDAANAWIRDVYLPAHNARFVTPVALPGTAFVAADPALHAETLCIEEDRVVARTVAYDGRRLQLPPARRAPTTSRRASRCANSPAPRRVPRPATDCALLRADRSGPDRQKRDTVLAAVKDAARRLRRWPMTLYPVTI